jgi:hypothetical protein
MYALAADPQCVTFPQCETFLRERVQPVSAIPAEQI